MKKKFIIILLCLAYIPASAQIKKDTSFVGIYLKALYDLSPSDFSFGADFYIWNNSTDSLPLFKKIEIINAKRIDEYSFFSDKDGPSFVNYENCKAQLTHNWDLKNYPFDKQKLQINIEGQEGIEYLYLTEDRNGFKIAKNLSIPGWKISKSYVEKSFATYPSDFGYHYLEITDKRFNHLAFVVELSRESWGLYFKLFTGLYIAFLVSFLAFFVRPDHVDPRFGLSIGGLFASVANKYVVDSNIPATIRFSFVDLTHFLSFIFILATLIISTISLKLYSRGKIEKSKSVDKKAARVIILLYISFNIILILFAV